MTAQMLLVFFSRWIHLTAACLLFGGAFFFYLIVPIATRLLDEQGRQAVFLKSRRGFKLIVHPMILLLLLSGTYNAIHNWSGYKTNMPTTHMLFGSHLLLGLIIFTILLVILAKREPIRSHRAWLRVTVVLLFLTVAAASGLKQAREHGQKSTTVGSHAP